jgi:hypothetical protein
VGRYSHLSLRGCLALQQYFVGRYSHLSLRGCLALQQYFEFLYWVTQLSSVAAFVYVSPAISFGSG